MLAVKFACPGTAALILAAAAMASPASATLTGDFTQSASPTPGYVLNQLKVQTDTDWITAQLLVELSAGELLYFTPNVGITSNNVVPGSPEPMDSIYDNSLNPTSATRPFGGTPLQAINQDIFGPGSLPDVASLLDNPPSLPEGSLLYYPGTASLTKFDLTWFGDPSQLDDIATGNDFLNIANVSANNAATGTWTFRLANEAAADDLEVSGIVFRGMLLASEPTAGDADLDGDVDSDDFNLLAFNFGNAGVWLNGDFDGDGTVDSDDFNLLAFNFGAGGPPPAPTEFAALESFAASIAVPEPTTGLMLLCATMVAGLRRRR